MSDSGKFDTTEHDPPTHPGIKPKSTPPRTAPRTPSEIDDTLDLVLRKVDMLLEHVRANSIDIADLGKMRANVMNSENLMIEINAQLKETNVKLALLLSRDTNPDETTT